MRKNSIHRDSNVPTELQYTGTAASSTSALPFFTNLTYLVPGSLLQYDSIVVVVVDSHIQRIVLVCVFSSHPFWTSSSLDVPAGVTQEEGHTGFLIHLPSAVRALIFVARRIQPFLSLVDREVEFCVLTN